jgi:hypothetical protein
VAVQYLLWRVNGGGQSGKEGESTAADKVAKTSRVDGVGRDGSEFQGMSV